MPLTLLLTMTVLSFSLFIMRLYNFCDISRWLGVYLWCFMWHWWIMVCRLPLSRSLRFTVHCVYALWFIMCTHWYDACFSMQLYVWTLVACLYIIMSCFASSVDLGARLQELKKDDETIDGFGKAMKDWVRWFQHVFI